MSALKASAVEPTTMLPSRTTTLPCPVSRARRPSRKAWPLTVPSGTATLPLTRVRAPPRPSATTRTTSAGTGQDVTADGLLHRPLAMAVAPGMWLFTRVLIPDVMLTLAVAFALWSFQRALNPNEPRWRLWALSSWAAIGVGILLKGLIAAIFPLGTAFLYLIFSGLWSRRETWRRLSLAQGIGVMLLMFLLAGRALDQRMRRRSRAVACDGDAAQSALFRFHDAQRVGVVSRIFLVLFL